MMVVVYEDGPYYTLISPWLCKEAAVYTEGEEELEEEGKEEEMQRTWGFVIPDALHWSLLINLKETITFYTIYVSSLTLYTTYFKRNTYIQF